MQINPTDGLHVEALDDFERVRTEELGHLSEIRRRRQIAVLAPLVIRRNAVIAPTLDVKREDIEAVRVVARLEQVVGILGETSSARRYYLVERWLHENETLRHERMNYAWDESGWRPLLATERPRCRNSTGCSA